MQRAQRCIIWAFTLAALVVWSAAGYAAESLPIKGTSKADTIEVTGKSGSSLTVKINGSTKTYSWSDNLEDREIKAGSGDDEITISINYSFIIDGEMGDDEIQGSESSDIILGGYGKDSIKGGNGNDWIDGGYNDDDIEGGPGNDIIYGKSGDDTIRAGAGNDYVDGGSGKDEIRGEDGDDKLYGESGKDTIRGGPGDDMIFGGDNDDTLRGDGGDDTLIGEGGSDTLEDSSVISESNYEDKVEEAMEEIEDDFGVGVSNFGRKWIRAELTFLRNALEQFPDKVLDCWGSAGKLRYKRKEVCSLPGYKPYASSGLQSTGIYLYDNNWGHSTSTIQDSWIFTITHETGHGFQLSPGLSSSQWKDFKELSDWQGSWPGGTYGPSAKFVSDYATTNAKEDWAETFGYYFTDPSTLKSRAPEKYDFMNDLFGMYSGSTATPVARPVADVKPATPQPAPAPKPLVKPKKPGRPPVRRPGRPVW